MSVEVLKECWDVVVKLDDMLTHHGVKGDCKTPIVHKRMCVSPLPEP